MNRGPVVLLLSVLLVLGSLPRPAVAQDRAADAAAAAVELSRLEAEGQYDAVYDRMHPDAQAVVPRQTVVGWYQAESAPLGPGVITVLSVEFVDWTWGVTGVTYPGAAEITFSQPYADGSVTEGVLRLVESEGEWRWFFGRDRAFVEAQTARFGGAPEPPEVQDEPAPPAPTEAPIIGETYTSPQFGYRISWQAPWESGTPISEPRQRDDFRLDGENVYLDYRGLFTDLSEEEALRAYAEERRQNTPGATIEVEEAAAAEPPTVLLRYPDASGQLMVETITVRSLVPDQAVLLRALGAPEEDLDPDEVSRQVALVTEELPGDEAQPVTFTLPGPNTADCSDVDRWWSETAERRQEAEDLLAGLGRVGPGSAPSYLDAVNGYARFAALADGQRASDPPGAASELNDTLVAVFDGLASVMWSFVLAGGDHYGPAVKPTLVARATAVLARTISDYSQTEPYEELAARCPAIAASLP